MNDSKCEVQFPIGKEYLKFTWAHEDTSEAGLGESVRIIDRKVPAGVDSVEPVLSYPDRMVSCGGVIGKKS